MALKIFYFLNIINLYEATIFFQTFPPRRTGFTAANYRRTRYFAKKFVMLKDGKILVESALIQQVYYPVLGYLTEYLFLINC